MAMSSKQQKPTFCGSEYDELHKVILCEPEHMAIHDVINETQKHFKQENIDSERALIEHREFTEALRNHGVDVILLTPLQKYPEQVFTRDIGFTIGRTLFVAEMASEIRQGEENVLKERLESQKVPFLDLTKGSIEGGDVIVDRNTIYVGMSSRTNEQAVNQLKKVLPTYTIETIPFDEKYLHLDCVFNILSPEEALFFPNAFDKETIDMLESRFNLIEVTEEEQFTLGTNVLSIGNKKVFSLPVNRQVNSQLKARGYNVIEIDFSEIIKSGGSFRCCTLPVLRGNK
ncbi:dimethylarginine dimethylaminohydrolase family protein [Lederbergia citrea]|uniref:Dimethylarginine dimethylaminohydrolase family protein n=1 Tax=Lederbergia citrea TaxID=2833581 RepID=A0A942UI83_9BACI|nr:dimethylarginine dimethylaminohydrolase family protein [Lederbergia citrea]MBS4203377.1 dimethylarginine dimethylaminohydrolase family protein [Lederbergia citrea]MBS4221950.1 dimethylarginine dimethylaminohydrolase family protein [Lederbergia citrea]